MPTVNTVLGPVETADLGFTLSHEHVGTNAAGLRHTYPEFLDREGLLEQCPCPLPVAFAVLARAQNPGRQDITHAQRTRMSVRRCRRATCTSARLGSLFLSPCSSS